MHRHGAAREVVEREISASVAEFVHGLNAAFPGAVEGRPPFFRVAARGAAMEIQVVPGPDRVIALLRLPTIVVSLRFTAGSERQRTALLEYLDMATHRGGG